MKQQYMILCIEDERAVLDALVRDLEPFAAAFRIEAAEDATDARQAVDDFLSGGGRLALVLADHVMPGMTGVDFLVSLNADPRTSSSRKVLVTAQAGLADTIKAVNQARLHHYIAKPWTVENLHDVVREQLTHYVIERASDLLPFMNVLDTQELMQALRERPHAAE